MSTKLMNVFYALRHNLRQGSIFNKNSKFPVGHFYSPIVLKEEIDVDLVWESRSRDGVHGIDLNTEKQLELLGHLSEYYNELPFQAEEDKVHRYYYDNLFYTYTDGIVLYSIMRYFRPHRIIEVGSGFSSAVILDTNELFFKSSIDLTFIEPYPDRLYSLISETDRKNTTVLEKGVQSVPVAKFEELEAGDILLIDSSHVVKTGSDVNWIFSEILPVLKSGVLIHFHDIFYPFEYPKEWVLGGRNWNEDYFLKVFLMYNPEFEIVLFSDYIHHLHKEGFSKMPLCYKNSGGNIWIRRK